MRMAFSGCKSVDSFAWPWGRRLIFQGRDRCGDVRGENDVCEPVGPFVMFCLDVFGICPIRKVCAGDCVGDVENDSFHDSSLLNLTSLFYKSRVAARSLVGRQCFLPFQNSGWAIFCQKMLKLPMGGLDGFGVFGMDFVFLCQFGPLGDCALDFCEDFLVAALLEACELCHCFEIV